MNKLQVASGKSQAKQAAARTLLLVACVLLLSACQQPTPADTTRLKLTVAAGVTACRAYVLDTRLPRDAEMTDYCGRMFPTPEKALER